MATQGWTAVGGDRYLLGTKLRQAAWNLLEETLPDHVGRVFEGLILEQPVGDVPTDEWATKFLNYWSNALYRVFEFRYSTRCPFCHHFDRETPYSL